jgi:restriction endonuclease S subunit
MLLNEVCEIKTGLTLRDEIRPAIQGKYTLLQLGDIELTGQINVSSLILTEGDSSFDKFIVRNGDLIFRGRGAGIAVAQVPNDGHLYVVASPLIILRPILTLLDPTFLAMMLTSNLAKSHFSKFIQGSSIMGIGVIDLKTFDFPLPDLKFQKIIAAVKTLQKQEQKLLYRLAATKNRIINQEIDKLLTHHEIIHKECIND